MVCSIVRNLIYNINSFISNSCDRFLQELEMNKLEMNELEVSAGYIYIYVYINIYIYAPLRCPHFGVGDEWRGTI